MLVGLLDDNSDTENVIDATEIRLESSLIIRLRRVQISVNAFQEDLAEEPVHDRCDGDGAVVFWKLIVTLLEEDGDPWLFPVHWYLVSALQNVAEDDG